MSESVHNEEQSDARCAAQTIATTLPSDARALKGAEEAVAAEWNVGDVILETYEVKEIHEGGGMGLVYRVHHRNWNMDLAVKSPRANFFQTQQQKDNFVRECETWIDLGLHPHIVSCHYVRNLGGIPRVFAEYVEGGTLKDWIDSKRLYEGGPEKALERILDIAIQMAWGLQYAHDNGLIHQDVKPANVLMTEDCTAKVSDFGLARARAAAGEKYVPGSGRSILVSTGGMTPAYCSPEQANHQSLSHKTDIWSWAVSMLEMFTGEVTWSYGQAVGEILEVFLQTGAEDSEIPRMPEELIKLLRQCFKRDPDQRPKDMAEVVGNLRGAYRMATGQDHVREQPKPSELLADSLNNKAVSLCEIEKPDAAMQLWGKALEVQPSHLESTYNLGLIRWRNADITDDTFIDTLLRLNAGSHKSLRAFMLAHSFVERGDYSTFKEAVESISNVCTNVAAAKVVRTFGDSPGRLRQICLSEDACLLADVRDNGLLLIWDVSTGRRIHEFDCRSYAPQSVVFGVQNETIVLGGREGELHLIDQKCGGRVREIHGHKGAITSLAFCSTRKLIASASDDGTLKLWELVSGNCIQSFIGHKGRLCDISFVNDGKRVVSASKDGALRLWDTATGECIAVLQGHSGMITSMAVSGDGRFAISGCRLSMDRTIRLWDLCTGNCARILHAPTSISSGKSCCINYDGSRILTVHDEQLRVWEGLTGRCICTIDCCFPIEAIAMDGAAKTAVLASSRGDYWIIDLNSYKRPLRAAPFVMSRLSQKSGEDSEVKLFGKLIREASRMAGVGDYNAVVDLIRQARLVPGYSQHPAAMEILLTLYKWLPSVSLNGVWEIAAFGQDENCILSAQFAHNSRFFASCDRSGGIKIWDSQSWRPMRSLAGHRRPVDQVCLTADDRRLLSVCGDEIRVWDVDSGECLLTLRMAVHKAELTPDGLFVLCSDHEGVIHMLDLNTGLCVRSLKGDNRGVTSLVVAPNGLVVASGDYNGRIHLWNLASGRYLQTWSAHESHVDALCFTGDSLTLVSCGNHSIRFWDLNSVEESQPELQLGDKTDYLVLSLQLTSDNRYCVVGGYSHVEILDVKSGKLSYSSHGSVGNKICLSPDRCFMVIISNSGLSIWGLDWDLERKPSSNWDEDARPYLTNFLTLHTPYVSTDPNHSEFLVRRGKPTWNHEDWQGLIRTLQCAGYGWLRPESVGRELEKMAANWNGPPPLPWEK